MTERLGDTFIARVWETPRVSEETEVHNTGIEYGNRLRDKKEMGTGTVTERSKIVV